MSILYYIFELEIFQFQSNVNKDITAENVFKSTLCIALGGYQSGGTNVRETISIVFNLSYIHEKFEGEKMRGQKGNIESKSKKANSYTSEYYMSKKL